ncbi:MAG: hypothetical protein KC421_17735 [Anaerolineales bacterium]|nr:hypothetical protein [Anaerolineales bacterium]
MNKERQQRLKNANRLIKTIATHGRRLLSNNESITQILMDERQRLWLLDAYTQKKIYLHYQSWGHGFSDGGTMRQLIVLLKQYILTGQTIHHSFFGPWPQWLCNGDIWGYGEDMNVVRSIAQDLGIINPLNNDKVLQ